MKMLSMPDDSADPAFNSSGHIDLLLGITVYTHILQKVVKIGTLALVETLVWTVSGKATY